MEPASLLRCAALWVIFSASWINSTTSYVLFNIQFNIILPPLTNQVRFFAKLWYVFLSSSMRTTYAVRLIDLHVVNVYDVKVKWSRYRPGVAQRVGRSIVILFHDRGTRRGWVVSSTPRPLYTPGKDPVLILQEALWAPGPVWTGGKSRPHRDSIPDRPVCSQQLYRLSYAETSTMYKHKLWSSSLCNFASFYILFRQFHTK